MSEFTLDSRSFPNGTVLVMGISYGPAPRPVPGPRGRTTPKVFTYALLKAGGLWYVTGSGKVPTAAGWGAVEQWLSRDNRVVEWARVALTWSKVYDATEIGSSPVSALPSCPD